MCLRNKDPNAKYDKSILNFKKLMRYDSEGQILNILLSDFGYLFTVKRPNILKIFTKNGEIFT